eukprot:3389382-Heterocapsa_arctica.AAC.1
MPRVQLPEEMFSMSQHNPDFTNPASRRPAFEGQDLTTTTQVGQALRQATLPFTSWGTLGHFEHAEAAFSGCIKGAHLDARRLLLLQEPLRAKS